MKNKIGMKIASYGIVLVLALSIFAGLSTIASASEQQPTVNYTTRGEIYIWDGDYTDGVSSGTGVESDPYIIEGWEIDGSVTGYGIVLDYTNAYVVIRDCYIYGARDSSSGYSAGVLLYASNNITVENCTIDDNDIGISIDLGTHIIVNECDLDGNGIIDTGGGGGFEFTGIDIIHCTDVTVSKTRITNENTVSIRMWYSQNCILEENYIANGTEHGIDFRRSSYNIIRNNYITDCLNGLYASSDSGGTYTVEYNTIYNNTIISNTEKGIFLYNTVNNTFYFNNLINNGATVIEYNTLLFNGAYYSNIWYFDYSSKLVGNYYSDYTGADTTGDGIGEEPYVIVNQEPEDVNIDLYPLAEAYNGTLPTPPVPPPTWSESITNLLIGLLPFIIMFMVIKNIHGWMDKGFKTKK